VCIRGFLLVFFLICLPTLATSALPTYPDLDKNEQITPNGFFEVYLNGSKGWQFVGRLGFDRYFREKILKLGSYGSERPNLGVRIVQKGGHGAHIDEILLNENPPVSATENNFPVNMYKISHADFDVLDGHDKTFEFSFSNTAADNVLKIIARVEAEKISEIPFHFPVTNLFKKITPSSDFYTYSMRHHVLSNSLGSEPFFKEWSLCGSGHPNAYTYGWVWHDSNNLYVLMDFSADNTCDGLKDYAKVYVKTDGDIKTFKMSMGDTQWGTPEFKYTNSVEYQHKVYPFTIPLSELGNFTPETLDLAFAAYGTAAAALMYFYEVLMNTGPGGGSVDVQQQGESATINNVNYIVRAWTSHLWGETNTVMLDRTETWEWNGTDFTLIHTDNTSYEITGTQGQGGTKALEFCADIANIANYSGTFTGVFHASRQTDLSDYSSVFTYGPLSIPTFNQWGLIILSLILISGSLWALRRARYQKSLYFIVLIFLFAVTTWAATIIIDGDMSDWNSIDAIVTDQEGDPSLPRNGFTGTNRTVEFAIGPDLNEDIRYGYVTSDADKIYFRVDYTGAIAD